jgi:hypothetical protein
MSNNEGGIDVVGLWQTLYMMDFIIFVGFTPYLGGSKEVYLGVCRVNDRFLKKPQTVSIV